MTIYHVPFAHLRDGLARDVRLVEEDGRWVEVTANASPRDGLSGGSTAGGPSGGTPSGVSSDDASSDDVIRLDGVALPGFANCHSHAFHRALRGRTHDDGGTFWTWRERMYRVAAQLDPSTYLALARAVYAEMALAGVTAVGEFHYVHHRPDGTPYDDPNAMGSALRQAAREAGIRFTLLDTCYLHGGLDTDGHAAVSAEQQRFSDGSVDAWARRHAQLREDALSDENTVVGAAIHSVRAVARDELADVVAATPGEILHAHVSEQPAENAAALAHYQRTPVGLLHEAGALSERFSAVHATHLSDDDVSTLARAGATACFCPTTERDLADGIGPAVALHDAGARLSLGSDQHAVIDMFEEARGLEMHERLTSNERGRLSPRDLLAAATRHASIGWADAGEIVIGARADLVVVEAESLRTAGCSPDQILLAAIAQDVTDVIVDGRVVVRGGRHRLEETPAPGGIGRLLHDAIDPFWRQT